MVVLGTTTMPIHQVLRLSRGAIIELDATEADEVKVLANNLPIASGVVLVDRNASRSRSSRCCRNCPAHGRTCPTHIRILAMRIRPSDALVPPKLEERWRKNQRPRRSRRAQGMPGAQPHPQASWAEKENAHKSSGKAEIARHSLRNGFTAAP
jgi:flagellar motor switch protein FliN/FliY